MSCLERAQPLLVGVDLQFLDVALAGVAHLAQGQRERARALEDSGIDGLHRSSLLKRLLACLQRNCCPLALSEGQSQAATIGASGDGVRGRARGNGCGRGRVCARSLACACARSLRRPAGPFRAGTLRRWRGSAC